MTTKAQRRKLAVVPAPSPPVATEEEAISILAATIVERCVCGEFRLSELSIGEALADVREFPAVNAGGKALPSTVSEWVENLDPNADRARSELGLELDEAIKQAIIKIDVTSIVRRYLAKRHT